jgi:hypothetical protein
VIAVEEVVVEVVEEVVEEEKVVPLWKKILTVTATDTRIMVEVLHQLSHVDGVAILVVPYCQMRLSYTLPSTPPLQKKGVPR